jgi:hypothetical protein
VPTTRTRRRRSFQPAVTPTQWALLTDQPIPDEPGIGRDLQRWCFNWRGDGEPPWREKSGRELWAAHGDAVLAGWIAEHPGTRPSCWWKFDAPGPRQRVGGVGTPAHEVSAYMLELHLGAPCHWITDHWLKFLPGQPIDPANPPMYESQANFLDRYNLLLPGERQRLRDVEFAPERITDILELDI